MIADTFSNEQLAEVRDLVARTGYLPQSKKADRLVAQLERGDPEAAALAESFRLQLASVGYLSQSKARQLIEAVEKSRR